MDTQFADIKNRLTTKRDELNQRLAKIEHDRHHKDAPPNSDSEERAVDMENDEVLDALDDASINELKAINKALARIENGDYGTCTNCGEVISKERLEAVPATELCMACAMILGV